MFICEFTNGAALFCGLEGEPSIPATNQAEA